MYNYIYYRALPTHFLSLLPITDTHQSNIQCPLICQLSDAFVETFYLFCCCSCQIFQACLDGENPGKFGKSRPDHQEDPNSRARTWGMSSSWCQRPVVGRLKPAGRGMRCPFWNTMSALCRKDFSFFWSMSTCGSTVISGCGLRYPCGCAGCCCSCAAGCCGAP